MGNVAHRSPRHGEACRRTTKRARAAASASRAPSDLSFDDEREREPEVVGGRLIEIVHGHDAVDPSSPEMPCELGDGVDGLDRFDDYARHACEEAAEGASHQRRARGVERRGLVGIPSSGLTESR